MKLKIGIVGSSGCGKSFVANILGAEGGVEGNKPPYRPTHSVRIIEFTCSSLPLHKYTLDVDVQLWEVGGDPSTKMVWPGVQWGLDGVIVLYDVGKEASVREASTYYMSWVTHSPTGLTPAQCILIGNKFRGSAEHGPQRVVGVPPRSHHVAVNIEDDPTRLRDEVKTFIARVAQQVIDLEKANLITPDPSKTMISRKFTPVEFHLFQKQGEPEGQKLEKRQQKRHDEFIKQDIVQEFQFYDDKHDSKMPRHKRSSSSSYRNHEPSTNVERSTRSRTIVNRAIINLNPNVNRI
ncbi:intraflagellar transport protein 22 homolog [Folsomia candida]|uniref:intraflagellar transport protein 22 homolog n=1 Tax=Folsomia candida TaxID=158441 RepID=UPI000B90848C|nr:intraflagellar transport protein 22 homolog [Folsomia candida]